MKKKRILFLFVTLFASTLLYSQVVGVKTNVVMDALKIINLGAEVGLSKKLTLDLYANYNSRLAGGVCCAAPGSDRHHA